MFELRGIKGNSSVSPIGEKVIGGVKMKAAAFPVYS
jgi:hypothetical protein